MSTDLIPTLLSLSTTRLPFLTLSKSLNQVCVYISKFRTRLLAENILHLKRLVVFLDALKKYVSEWKELILRTSQEGKGKERTEVLTVAELLDRLGRKVGGVNLLEVEGYLRRSKVLRWSFFMQTRHYCLNELIYFTDSEEDRQLLRQGGREKCRFVSGPPSILHPNYSSQALGTDPANSRHPQRGTIPPLHHVEAFMLSLTGTNDGMHSSIHLRT
jgi:chromosome transmission fidelity protein 1